MNGIERSRLELVELRRALHCNAELSGGEQRTALLINETLKSYRPDEIVGDLGGLGMAAIFKGSCRGLTVLFRAEMDALPIPETLKIEHSSFNRGVSHKCGHDGHMAIVLGLARHLHKHHPKEGRVVLLFQPGEENGQGAKRVIADPRFAEIAPDFAFALHNTPGFPLGEVILRGPVFASASKGLIVRLKGVQSHAAKPENGINPALAVARLIQDLSDVARTGEPLHRSARLTVIHARLGQVAFGTSPGEAEVMATLRSHSNDVMEDLSNRSVSLAKNIAKNHKLDCAIEWADVFPPTINDEDAAAKIERAAKALGMSVRRLDEPFSWSEDFGHFTAVAKGAMFGLGAGESQPELHSPVYDFPDELIDVGVRLLTGIADEILGTVQARLADPI
jgi:amidohydrolase